MLDCCDRVIAIAKHSYTMIHELYGLPQSKISYIPNGLICKYREYNNEERRSLRKNIILRTMKGSLFLPEDWNK